VSIDAIIFEKGERDPDEDLKLQFAAVSHFTLEEKI